MRNGLFARSRQHLIARGLSRCPSRRFSKPLGTFWSPNGPSLTVGPNVQHRGAKSKATLQLNELPLPRVKNGQQPLEVEDAGPAYPTVVSQARNNMRKYDNCVLLTRVGSFYEVCTILTEKKTLAHGVIQLYFDQADKYGPLLNLKVAQKKTAAGPVSMVLVFDMA